MGCVGPAPFSKQPTSPPVLLLHIETRTGSVQEGGNNFDNHNDNDNCPYRTDKLNESTTITTTKMEARTGAPRNTRPPISVLLVGSFNPGDHLDQKPCGQKVSSLPSPRACLHLVSNHVLLLQLPPKNVLSFAPLFSMSVPGSRAP